MGERQCKLVGVCRTGLQADNIEEWLGTRSEGLLRGNGYLPLLVDSPNERDKAWLTEREEQEKGAASGDCAPWSTVPE